MSWEKGEIFFVKVDWTNYDNPVIYNPRLLRLIGRIEITLLLYLQYNENNITFFMSRLITNIIWHEKSPCLKVGSLALVNDRSTKAVECVKSYKISTEIKNYFKK